MQNPRHENPFRCHGMIVVNFMGECGHFSLKVVFVNIFLNFILVLLTFFYFVLNIDNFQWLWLYKCLLFVIYEDHFNIKWPAWILKNQKQNREQNFHLGPTKVSILVTILLNLLKTWNCARSKTWKHFQKLWNDCGQYYGRIWTFLKKMWLWTYSWTSC